MKFLKPEITLIDLQYSFLDRFAIFGGKFGIFAQLTGSSFLGLLSITIMIMKRLFNPN